MVFHWRRPLLTTYQDNYKYGTSLYSGTVDDAEKKYRESLSKTHVRSDRGDLGLYSFAGSHVHGGTPAASSGSAVGSSSSKSAADLYAPLSFGYGRNYYNSLRGETPTRSRKQDTKTTKSYDYYTMSDEASSDLKTHAAKTTTSYDDLKKTVTTTTTTERWVPLSSYLYSPTYYYYTSSPYTRTSKTMDDTYYSYSDDYNVKTTSSKSRNLDALDLNISSYNYDKFDYNNWMEKCHEIQSQLEQVNRWVAEADSKIKGDVVGARNKMQQELADVTLLVDDTTKYNEELQRVIKRQARQITDLNSQYDEINRHLADVSDTLEKSRSRCQTLSGELSSITTGIEMAFKRRQ